MSERDYEVELFHSGGQFARKIKVRATNRFYAKRAARDAMSAEEQAALERLDLVLFVEDGNDEHDPVNAPSHYKGNGEMQPIDVIEAFALGFNLGNTVKYVLRAGKKGCAVEDLEKARWYLTREIEQRRADARSAEAGARSTETG